MMLVAHGGGSVGHVTAEYLPLVLPVLLVGIGFVILLVRGRRGG